MYDKTYLINTENEKYSNIQNMNLLDFANSIQDIVYQNKALRKENQELKQQVKELRTLRDKMLNNFNESHANSINAIISGDLKINKNNKLGGIEIE